MSARVSIATACDRQFLWGAFLLAASAARHLPAVPFHLLQTGFTPEDEALFRQWPQVRVHALAKSSRRSVCNHKAEAILQAETEYAAWLDADCLVVGDIGEMLLPANGEFQIRLRAAPENAWVWRNHYAPGEARGGLPLHVREQWRADVQQLAEPRLDTTCVSNAFVLHRRHFPFIREWQRQIDQVIPKEAGGVVHKKLPAYFMTDESVLSSLLAFSHLAPPIGELQLDRDPGAHLAHFGASPKPWKRWRRQTWYCHSHVMALLDWVRATGGALPEVPWSLRAQNRLSSLILATASHAWGAPRSLGAQLLRK